MTDEQWARFAEALQVAYAKRPQEFRALVDAMPEDARQAFVAGVFASAADHLRDDTRAETVAEFEAQAEAAADPKSDAYAYPPVSGED